jgi:hypothetical protein
MGGNWQNWQMVIVEPVKSILVRIAQFIPDLLAALVIFFVGWLLAKLIKTLVIKFLQLVKLDLAAEKSGVADFLVKGEIKNSLSEILGIIAYWVVMLIVLICVVNVLGLRPAVDLLNAIIQYLPSVVAGVIVLVLGALFATLMGSLIQTALANAGIVQAKPIAEVSKYVILVFAIIIALDKFIGSVIIQSFFNILLATVGLTLAIAVGLAVGLGAKDSVGKLIAEFINKFRR